MHQQEVLTADAAFQYDARTRHSVQMLIAISKPPEAALVNKQPYALSAG